MSKTTNRFSPEVRAQRDERLPQTSGRASDRTRAFDHDRHPTAFATISGYCPITLT
jgi:hypothetical protein